MAHFTLDNSLGYIINQTALRLKLELRQAFKTNGYDITPEQWIVLNRLWKQDGLSQVELATLASKDKPNITRMLDVLERKALITRHKDEQDRRAYKIYLTELGKGLEAKLVPLAMAVLAKSQQGLTEDDILLLRDKLTLMYDNLENVSAV